MKNNTTSVINKLGDINSVYIYSYLKYFFRKFSNFKSKCTQWI